MNQHNFQANAMQQRIGSLLMHGKKITICDLTCRQCTDRNHTSGRDE